ncbi:hypothetical protein, partial [Tianweitania sediminis]
CDDFDPAERSVRGFGHSLTHRRMPMPYQLCRVSGQNGVRSNSTDFHPDRMIIYHWSSFAISATAAVESFTALATFKAYYTGSLWVYGLVIVALGAMGSAVQNTGASLMAWTFGAGPMLSNLVLFLMLIFALALIVLEHHRKT